MLVDLKCKMKFYLACKILFFIAVLTKVVFMVVILKLITLNIASFDTDLKLLFFILVASDLVGGLFVFKFYSLIKGVKG